MHASGFLEVQCASFSANSVLLWILGVSASMTQTVQSLRNFGVGVDLWWICVLGLTYPTLVTSKLRLSTTYQEPSGEQM